jgi:hypothetical protein
MILSKAKDMAKKKNAIAQALVAMRNRKLTPQRRAEIAKQAAQARWQGHQAKRPAASRSRGK